MGVFLLAQKPIGWKQSFTCTFLEPRSSPQVENRGCTQQQSGQSFAHSLTRCTSSPVCELTGKQHIAAAGRGPRPHTGQHLLRLFCPGLRAKHTASPRQEHAGRWWVMHVRVGHGCSAMGNVRLVLTNTLQPMGIGQSNSQYCCMKNQPLLPIQLFFPDSMPVCWLPPLGEDCS
jgi:hypothetical protein